MRFYRIYNPKKIKNKVVHLMMMEKFTESYICIINNLFPVSQNDFIIYGGPVHKGIELHCLREKNVYTIMNGYLFRQPKYKNFLLKHKKIIIHGLFEAGIIENWAGDSDLLARTYIFLYGAYLSQERINDSDYCKIIQGAAGIINLYKIEKKLVENLYHPKGIFFNAFYLSLAFEHLKDTKKRKNENGILKIQVGNSASESMRHLEIISKLSKFINESIEVYVPLSYGDMRYADEVEAYGKKILGNKFISIREFMSPQKFNEFIASMDMAVFGMLGQQASENLDINLCLGNCIYLPKCSVMAEVYEKELECKIRYIEDIEFIDYEQFLNWNQKDSDYNSLKILNYYSKDNFKNKWKNIFDYSLEV